MISSPKLLLVLGLCGLALVAAADLVPLQSDPAGATFPGDNGKIAFETDRDGNFEVYVMDADGSGQSNLSNEPSDEGNPAWSPDGAKIAFASNRDGNFEIYVMNGDGSGRTRLTSGPGDEFLPSWSPDGAKITFESHRDGNAEIYVMNADGTAQTNLTNNELEDEHPAWSPDGAKIAFLRFGDGDVVLHVMNADGSDESELVNSLGFDGFPSWSPDGSQIAFSSSRDGNDEIYVMNADGSDQVRLTSSPAEDRVPAWSPDGSKIAFRSDRDDTLEIYVMNADGSDQVRLTNNTAVDGKPDWQPLGPTPTPTATDTPTTAPLRLGVLVPFTGALSTFGPDYLNAAQLAANEINAAGGVNGGQVLIVTGDTGTNPAQGVTEAQRLVDVEGVVAIMGAASSAVSLAVAETVTIPNGVLQISPASTSAALTDVMDNDLLFRTAISDNAQALVLAQLVSEDLGLTSVCDLHVNNAYGHGLAKTFADDFADLGGTVKASVPHDDSEAISYLAELNECTAGDPEALIAMSYPTGQATVYLREALEGDIIDNFVFVDGTREDDIFNELGWELFDGMLGTAPGTLQTDLGDAFDNAFEAEFGAAYSSPFVREAFDAIVALALAAQDAGTNTDSVAIRDSLRRTSNAPGTIYGPGEGGIAAALAAIAAGEDIDYEGASSSLDFDENGDIAQGGVKTWHVDCATETLLTDNVFKVDVTTGESTLEQEITTPTASRGDVNGDSATSSIDAALVLQHSAGLFGSICPVNADVNGDGNITSVDAALILQFTAGLLGSLPP